MLQESDARRNQTKIVILVRSVLEDSEKFRLRDAIIDALAKKNYSRTSFHNVDTEFCRFINEFCVNSLYPKIFGSNLEEYIRKGRYKNSLAFGLATNAILGVPIVIIMLVNRFTL